MNNIEVDFANNAIYKDGKQIATITAIDSCAEQDIEDVFDNGSRISKEDIENLDEFRYQLLYSDKYNKIQEALEDYDNDECDYDDEFMMQLQNLVKTFDDIEIK